MCSTVAVRANVQGRAIAQVPKKKNHIGRAPVRSPTLPRVEKVSFRRLCSEGVGCCLPVQRFQQRGLWPPRGRFSEMGCFLETC